MISRSRPKAISAAIAIATMMLTGTGVLFAATSPARAQLSPQQLILPGLEPHSPPQQLQLPLPQPRPAAPERQGGSGLREAAGQILDGLAQRAPGAAGYATGIGLGMFDAITATGTCNTLDERYQRAVMNAGATMGAHIGGGLVGSLVTSALGGNNPGIISQSVGNATGKAATWAMRKKLAEKIEQQIQNQFTNEERLAFELCRLTQAGATIRQAFERAFDLRFAEKCDLRIAEVDRLERAAFEQRFACAYRDPVDRAALESMVNEVFQANLTVCRAGLALVREMAPQRLQPTSSRPAMACRSGEDVTRTWQAYLDARLN